VYPSKENGAVEKREVIKELFGLRFGGMIGPLERVFYIYAIMMPQLTILTPIIVLKAFFGWITHERIDAFLSTLPADRSALAKDLRFVNGIVYVLYHSYIYGNILSLMLGLALGHVGVVVRGLPAAIASPTERICDRPQSSQLSP
jgi:hypothetical protein